MLLTCDVCFFASAVFLLGLLGYAATQNQQMESGDPAAEPAAQRAEEAAPLPRENAVLVFGASGKLGRKIVEKVRSSAGYYSQPASRMCSSHHYQDAGGRIVAHRAATTPQLQPNRFTVLLHAVHSGACSAINICIAVLPVMVAKPVVALMGHGVKLKGTPKAIVLCGNSSLCRDAA